MGVEKRLSSRDSSHSFRFIVLREGLARRGESSVVLAFDFGLRSLKVADLGLAERSVEGDRSVWAFDIGDDRLKAVRDFESFVCDSSFGVLGLLRGLVTGIFEALGIASGAFDRSSNRTRASFAV